MHAKHEQFSSKLGFIMAAAGSAVGIGNLVGFPVNAAKNGGGAFLLIYLLFVVLVCMPLLLSELSIGRSTGEGPLGAFRKVGGSNKLWLLGGLLPVLTPFMIGVFYTVITVWILGYLIISVSGGLQQLAQPEYFGQFINADNLIAYQAGVIGVVLLILFGGVRDGIERTARYLMPALFLMLLGLVVFVLTLEGAAKGVQFYLQPDFSRISIDVINGALSQAFFSLSLGTGVLIMYGAYLRKTDDLPSSGRFLALADTSVAFFAGLMTIPAIFAIYPDTDPASLSSSSVSLIFSFFPKIFMEMVPLLGYQSASALAVIFFALAFIAAITSLVSIFEVPTASLADETPLTRRQSLLITVALASGLSFAASLSFGKSQFLTEFVSYAGQMKSFFDVLVDLFYDTVLPVNGFILCLLILWRWKIRQLSDELSIQPASQGWLERYTAFAMVWVVPWVLLFVAASTIHSKFF